jgi:Flp pilus assembly pilin Flp
MVKILRKEGLQRVMTRMPSDKGGQGFIEYALIIILISIAILSILLIFGDDIRTVINDLLQQWFPARPEVLRNLVMPT